LFSRLNNSLADAGCLSYAENLPRISASRQLC